VSAFDRLTLALRVLMEVGIVVGLAIWGVETGQSFAEKVVLGVIAPVAGFGFWAAVDFRGAGRWAEPARLTQELALSGLAALAWYSTGQRVPALLLAALSVAYHAVVYASGRKLLKAS